MLQIGGRLDLGEEALAADHRGELGPQHLDRDVAVVPEVVREVDGGHAARAELALDAVAVGEGDGEPVEDVGHAVALGRLAGGREAIEGMLHTNQGGSRRPTADHDEMLIVGRDVVFAVGIAAQNEPVNSGRRAVTTKQG